MPGAPIDPGTARRLAEIFERRPDVDDFERVFLNGVKARFQRFGAKTHLSEKQATIIESVYVRMCPDLGEDPLE